MSTCRYGRTIVFAGSVLLACSASGGCGGDDGSSAAGDAAPDDGGGVSEATTGDGPGPDVAPAADSGPDAPVPTATLHYRGRFDTRDPAGPRFAWPGSAIAATFQGTGVTAKLHDSGTNFFTVVVDGGAPKVVATSGASDVYPLAAALPSGTHTVVLTKRTESFVGVVQFLGLAVAGGALVPSPEPFTRRIEFVGDSISCGYGDLGAGPSCHFSADTEDVTIAYDELAAGALDAQATVVAYSGIGVYVNYGGSMTDTMPVRFERTLADDATSTWGFGTPPPDVVVVNLGTNDFAGGDPGAAFQQAYVQFLQQLRSHYATANIVCALSPMLADPARSQARAYLQAAVAQRTGAGDARVSYFEFDQQLASDGFGCDYHPSPATHQKMAAKLQPAIQQLAGW